MVGHLVSLKWQYVLASFRRSIWALIGLIFAALYAGGMLFGLGSAYVIANSKVPEYGQLGTLLVGTVVALAWAVVPIFFSGLDGTLDESRFVLFPIKPSTCRRVSSSAGSWVSPASPASLPCCWVLSRLYRSRSR